LSCNGLVVLSINTNANNIEWSTGSFNQEIEISEPGTYSYTLSNTCETVVDSITIEPQDDINNIEYSIEQVGSLICDGTIELIVRTNADNIIWNTGAESFEIQVNESGEYSFTLSNDCESLSDFITIDRQNDSRVELFIPNAFTPNDDGQNDQFGPFITSDCVEVTSYQMKIFNRWGGLIFVSDDPAILWAGFETGYQSAEGVYVYVITVNGRETSGDVTLLR